MKALRQLLDQAGHHFEKGGRYERLYPIWEAFDTFLYAPGSRTTSGAHVRDALDLKRMMMMVIIAAIPCVLMAMHNTGLQANLAIDPARAAFYAARGLHTICPTQTAISELLAAARVSRRHQAKPT